MLKATARQDLARALVLRRKEDHKGYFGHVLIAAGSRGMAGAALLAARAAARSGAGLVTLALPKSIQGTIAGQVPEAMTLGLPESLFGRFNEAAARALAAACFERNYSVLAVGPGISTSVETRRFLIWTLKAIKLPLVIDADALNILAEIPGSQQRALLAGRPAGSVATPHPGEIARCLKSSSAWVGQNREAAARKLAREWGCTSLLKGNGTIISDGRRALKNPTGSPALAKGGSGDALTGLIAGLFSQLLAGGQAVDAAWRAAYLGAWIHGKAGEIAGRRATAWASTASLLIDCFPEAFQAAA